MISAFDVEAVFLNDRAGKVEPKGGGNGRVGAMGGQW